MWCTVKCLVSSNTWQPNQTNQIPGPRGQYSEPNWTSQTSAKPNQTPVPEMKSNLILRFNLVWCIAPRPWGRKIYSERLIWGLLGHSTRGETEDQVSPVTNVEWFSRPTTIWGYTTSNTITPNPPSNSTCFIYCDFLSTHSGSAPFTFRYGSI